MINYPGEEWKPIFSCKGAEVSNFGRIRKKVGNGKKFELVVTRYQGKYISVTLDRKRYLVHRLVARTFVPNPFKYKTVNHIDYNPENNYVENLEWVSEKWNQIHANRRPESCKSWLKGNQALEFLKHQRLKKKNISIREEING